MATQAEEKCVCGSDNFSHSHPPYYWVDEAGNTLLSDEKFLVGTCTRCGIVRQLGVKKDLAGFYKKEYPPLQSSYQVKNYEHDVRVASLRCDDYGVFPGTDLLVLDIGSGSGAFVDTCRQRGARAFGCEIGQYHYSQSSQYIYNQPFEQVGFPTDYFQMVTCHDVLEHVLDPLAFLQEAFRVVQQGGNFIIDFPRFHHESGKHHWKKEHIWYFTDEQLETLLKQVGFEVDKVAHPVESKTVFYCDKPEQQRPSILVPPGIGDSYWSIVKLESFLKWKKLPLPDITVVCPKSKKHNGHQRAFPFLEMFPFLNPSWETVDSREKKSMAIWKEAYAQEGRTIFEQVLGYDYFISYNGHLRVGKELDLIDPHLECNWQPKMFVSLEQSQFQESCSQRFGKYIVFYFIFQGTYQYWTNEFPIHYAAEYINKTIKETGYKAVFTGGKWDAEDQSLNRLKALVPGHIDLVGKTSVAQLFGLVKGSQAVVGYPSGLTIMSAVLGAKTLCIWNDYYNQQFFWYAMPPVTRGKNYHIDVTRGLAPDYLARRTVSLVNGKICPQRQSPLPPPAIKQEPPPRRVIAPIKKKKLSLSPVLPVVTKSGDPVSVACVLKSGGDYNQSHVQILYNMVDRRSTIPVKFFCLTDQQFSIPNVNTIPLKDALPGWWSKIELFRPDLFSTERVVYFDLDTVLVNNIDPLLALKESSFYALLPWNPKNRANGYLASGVMSWRNGFFPFIYKDFTINIIDNFPGDQHYISEALMENGVSCSPLQSCFPGIYSYKRQCRNRLPWDVRVVCFHGSPRPFEVVRNIPWVGENYR